MMAEAVLPYAMAMAAFSVSGIALTLLCIALHVPDKLAALRDRRAANPPMGLTPQPAV